MKSNKTIRFFLLMIILIQPGCLIKGCNYEADFNRGMMEGEEIGILEGRNMTYDDKRNETKDYYLDLGYNNGIDKAISEKKYSLNIYKCIISILFFTLIGFFTQYFICLFLRKKGFINDIDNIITPDINSINLSEISSIDMNKMLQSSINRLESIVEKKMITYQPPSESHEDVYNIENTDEFDENYNNNTIGENGKKLKQSIDETSNDNHVRNKATSEKDNYNKNIPQQKTNNLSTKKDYIFFKCQCGKSFKIPSKNAGKKGKCKKCGKIIHIPSKN